MIHTLFVTPETEPEALRKLSRKKLMTGGAVVRLAPELGKEALHAIWAKFQPEAERFSLAAQVLTELAKHPELDEALNRNLRATNLPEVLRVLP